MTTMSSLPAPTRELAFGVNTDRLLGEVGLFFSSATAAFAECVQNAYRAEATRLRVTADPARRTIVFRDDGRGLSDPRPFLLVAESGWDATQVKHAAGMGSLALFAIASAVEIIAMPRDGGAPWRMHFTDAALRGEEPARVWDNLDASVWTEGGDEVSGVEIRATLRETATFPAMHGDASAAWRHRFPLAITVEAPNPKSPDAIERTTYTVEPYNGFRIDTAVGPIYVTGYDGRLYGAMRVEWEHRNTGSVAFDREVFDTNAGKALAPAVRAELESLLRRNLGLVWVVSSEAAVEAKLPDRETLVRDEGFRAAMEVIAEALIAEFDVPDIRDHFLAGTGGAPIIALDRIERPAKSEEEASATFRQRFGSISLSNIHAEPFLALAGYCKVSGGTSLDDVECYFSRSGDDVEFETEFAGPRRMVLPEYVTPFAEIAVEAGVRAISDAEATNRGDLIPLHIEFGESLAVGSLQAIFARDLRFVTPAGVTVATVPTSLFESAWDSVDDPDEPVILAAWESQEPPLQAIFAVPSDETPFADAVMTVARTSQAVLNYATVMAGAHRAGDFALDIWDYVEDDDSWESARIRADAVRVIAEAVGGDHVTQAEHTAALIELENLLDTPFTHGHAVTTLTERAEKAGVNPALVKRIVRAQRSLAKALTLARQEKQAALAA